MRSNILFVRNVGLSGQKLGYSKFGKKKKVFEGVYMKKKVRKTTKMSLFSKEFGGGFKRFFCLGTHVWKRIHQNTQKKGSLKEGRECQEIIVYTCVDCGRFWVLVTSWKEFMIKG